MVLVYSQHNDMVSVGVVAEGKYLTRDKIKSPKEIFNREVTQNKWIQEYLSSGNCTGEYYITNEYTFHSKHSSCQGLLLVGDAYCFLDPVFSSGLMLALKSGIMAGDSVSNAIKTNNFCPSQFTEYSTTLRKGIENMQACLRILQSQFYFQGYNGEIPRVDRGHN